MQSNFPVIVKRDGKHIIINWGNNPPDVISNITIKAKKKISYTTNMDAILIVYREKVE